MRRTLKIGAVAAVALAVVVGATLYWLFEASQQVPDFYRKSVARAPEDQQEARDEFVAATTALASDLHRSGRWQHIFTTEQVNAWLALELATNYPELLAGEWHEPRIAIDEHEATIACRYENGTVSTVMSLSVDVYLHEPNVVAIRIRRARAGALPVPLAQVLDAVSQAARALKLRLEWRKDHGDPVALVTFAKPPDSQSESVWLEAIELRKGELFVAGAMTRDLPKRLTGSDAIESHDTKPEEPSDTQPLIGAAAKETRQE